MARTPPVFELKLDDQPGQLVIELACDAQRLRVVALKTHPDPIQQLSSACSSLRLLVDEGGGGSAPATFQCEGHIVDIRFKTHKSRFLVKADRHINFARMDPGVPLLEAEVPRMQLLRAFEEALKSIGAGG